MRCPRCDVDTPEGTKFCVVVRAIGNDLHMDYTAVGQTTHLAARMEQLARPGTALLTADTLRLVEGLPTARLLLVNYRPEYQHGWGSKTYYTQLRLDPLPPASADEFLQALLGSDPSLAPLKQLLMARTQGNPFFLEESVRTLVETGGLVGTPGAYRLALAHLPGSRERDEQAIDVRFGLRAALGVRREDDRVLAYLRQAEGLAQGLAVTLGDAALLVVLHLFLGRAYHALGDYPQAIDLLRQNVAALDGARLHEHFGLPGLPSVMSRDLLARCLAELGAFTEGLAHGEDSLRIAEAVDHPYSLIPACYSIGHVYLRKGAWPQAIPWLERGLEVCRVWDFPLLFYVTSAALGYAYVLAGRVSDALPLLEQSVSTKAMENMRARVHVWLSEAYLRLGRLDAAWALAVRGLEFCRTYAQQGEQAWALRLLGEIHAHRHPPEAEQAEAAYRQALALAEALGMRPLQAHCHQGLGTLYAKIGHRELARTECSIAIELYRAMDMAFWLP